MNITWPRHFLLRHFALIALAALPATAISGGEFRQRANTTLYSSELAMADVTAEVEFGREVAAHVLGRYPLYKNRELTHYVNLVGQAVASQANRPELTFYFAILDTDEINAYTTPGGYVFVTRGALAKMKDESELAGVLAHEIAHVTQKHIVMALNIRGSEHSTGAALAHILGAINETTRTAFNQALDQAMSMLFEEGLSKEAEYESDQIGTLFLANAGYDPEGLQRYLSRIKSAKSEELNILSTTHPPLDDRLASLGAFTQAEQLQGSESKRFKQRFDSNLSL